MLKVLAAALLLSASYSYAAPVLVNDPPGMIAASAAPTPLEAMLNPFQLCSSWTYNSTFNGYVCNFTTNYMDIAERQDIDDLYRTITALRRQLTALEARVAELEARP